jgi:hypothetical protein
MKNILLLLLSLFIVSCSTTSYVTEYPETNSNYFSNLPTVSPTLTIVTYNSPNWTQNYYSNNIYTNHWPYTNNVYSNDYFGYYGSYTHYYLPNYYPHYYTPYNLSWYNNHCNNWNNWNNYHYSNGHRNFTPRTNYNTPRTRQQNNLSPRPVYNTPRQNNGGRTTTSTPRQNNNYSTPTRPTSGRTTTTTPTRTTTSTGGRR